MLEIYCFYKIILYLEKLSLLFILPNLLFNIIFNDLCIFSDQELLTDIISFIWDEYVVNRITNNSNISNLIFVCIFEKYWLNDGITYFIIFKCSNCAKYLIKWIHCFFISSF